MEFVTVIFVMLVGTLQATAFPVSENPVIQYKETTRNIKSLDEACRNTSASQAPAQQCHSFYRCNPTATQGQCPFPLLFSVVTRRCEPFEDVSCKDRLIPLTPCEYFEENCSLSVDGTRCTCNGIEDLDYNFCRRRESDFYVWPGRKWSPYYIRCEQGRTLPLKCIGPSVIFNFFHKDCELIYAVVNQAYNLSLAFQMSGTLSADIMSTTISKPRGDSTKGVTSDTTVPLTVFPAQPSTSVSLDTRKAITISTVSEILLSDSRHFSSMQTKGLTKGMFQNTIHSSVGAVSSFMPLKSDTSLYFSPVESAESSSNRFNIFSSEYSSALMPSYYFPSGQTANTLATQILTGIPFWTTDTKLHRLSTSILRTRPDNDSSSENILSIVQLSEMANTNTLTLKPKSSKLEGVASQSVYDVSDSSEVYSDISVRLTDNHSMTGRTSTEFFSKWSSFRSSEGVASFSDGFVHNSATSSVLMPSTGLHPSKAMISKQPHIPIHQRPSSSAISFILVSSTDQNIVFYSTETGSTLSSSHLETIALETSTRHLLKDTQSIYSDKKYDTYKSSISELSETFISSVSAFQTNIYGVSESLTSLYSERSSVDDSQGLFEMSPWFLQTSSLIPKTVSETKANILWTTPTFTKPSRDKFISPSFETQSLYSETTSFSSVNMNMISKLKSDDTAIIRDSRTIRVYSELSNIHPISTSHAQDTRNTNKESTKLSRTVLSTETPGLGSVQYIHKESAAIPQTYYNGNYSTTTSSSLKSLTDYTNILITHIPMLDTERSDSIMFSDIPTNILAESTASEIRFGFSVPVSPTPAIYFTMEVSTSSEQMRASNDALIRETLLPSSTLTGIYTESSFSTDFNRKTTPASKLEILSSHGETIGETKLTSPTPLLQSKTTMLLNSTENLPTSATNNVKDHLGTPLQSTQHLEPSENTMSNLPLQSSVHFGVYHSSHLVTTSSSADTSSPKQGMPSDSHGQESVPDVHRTPQVSFTMTTAFPRSNINFTGKQVSTDIQSKATAISPVYQQTPSILSTFQSQLSGNPNISHTLSGRQEGSSINFISPSFSVKTSSKTGSVVSGKQPPFSTTSLIQKTAVKSTKEFLSVTETTITSSITTSKPDITLAATVPSGGDQSASKNMKLVPILAGAIGGFIVLLIVFAVVLIRCHANTGSRDLKYYQPSLRSNPSEWRD